MMANARFIRFLATTLFFAWTIFATPAFALENEQLQQTEQIVKELRGTLDELRNGIDPTAVTEESLANQRATIEKITSDARNAAQTLEQPVKDVADQLSQLGPAPAEGATEPIEIANQRKLLVDHVAKLFGLQKQLELINVESGQTLARLSALERDQFFQRIFKSDRSILDPRLWLNGFNAAGQFVQRLGNLTRTWWSDVKSEASFAALFGVIASIAVAMFAILRFRKLLRNYFRTNHLVEAPSAVRRLWRVIFGLLQTAVFLLVFLLIVRFGINAAKLLTPHLELLYDAVAAVVLPTVLYTSLAYFVCQPKNREARLVAIGDGAARNLTLITAVSACTYSFGEEITALASTLSIPLSYSVAVSALSALILIGLVAIALTIIRREAARGLADGSTPYFLTWLLNFTPLFWALLLIALAALAFGFISLGLFISGNIVETALLGVVLGVLHAFAHALADAAGQSNSRTGQAIRSFTGWGEAAIERFILIFRTISDIAIAMVALFGLMALWAVSLVDFTSMMRTAAGGFQLGNITISPMALLAAALILIIGIAATRYITAWMQRRVLSATRLDKGVQDSVRTGAGYVGYILAAGFALSAAGVDFSNLALIAGALGVGIGFGLQSIVNNFVSGLILLAERPVRVGDWVETKAGEGIVKTINVRSTEIETFDNCTIIVPNSNLITDAVKNWTHRDTMGRYLVTLSVNYGTNADDVLKTILGIANNHPKTLRHPDPIAVLSKLTPTAMEFELRGHVLNVFDSYVVASDLRIAITKALGRSGLAILAPAAAPIEKPPTLEKSRKTK